MVVQKKGYSKKCSDQFGRRSEKKLSGKALMTERSVPQKNGARDCIDPPYRRGVVKSPVAPQEEKEKGKQPPAKLVVGGSR